MKRVVAVFNRAALEAALSVRKTDDANFDVPCVLRFVADGSGEPDVARTLRFGEVGFYIGRGASAIIATELRAFKDSLSKVEQTVPTPGVDRVRPCSCNGYHGDKETCFTCGGVIWANLPAAAADPSSGRAPEVVVDVTQPVGDVQAVVFDPSADVAEEIPELVSVLCECDDVNEEDSVVYQGGRVVGHFHHRPIVTRTSK